LLSEQVELQELSALLGKLSKDVKQGRVPPQLEEEAESWLDWGLRQAKEYGPLVAKVLPELLALL